MVAYPASCGDDSVPTFAVNWMLIPFDRMGPGGRRRWPVLEV